MSKEELTEAQKSVIKEAVLRINRTLVVPFMLRLKEEENRAVYEMATGTIDESGGGSVHDVDFYSFPARDLQSLIFTALGSPTRSAETVVNGFRFTDYVDWPYGREDGSETKRNNEPVTLRLKFAMQEDTSTFEVIQLSAPASQPGKT